VDAFKSAHSNGEPQRLEFEDEQARMEVAQVELQDQLRGCDIEIVTLDHCNHDLIQGLQHSETMTSQLESSLRDMKVRWEGTQHAHSKQLDELKNQLTQAKDGLNQSQNRSMELGKEARESRELVKSLQGELEMAKG